MFICKKMGPKLFNQLLHEAKRMKIFYKTNTQQIKHSFHVKYKTSIMADSKLWKRNGIQSAITYETGLTISGSRTHLHIFQLKAF